MTKWLRIIGFANIILGLGLHFGWFRPELAGPNGPVFFSLKESWWIMVTGGVGILLWSIFAAESESRSSHDYYYHPLTPTPKAALVREKVETIEEDGLTALTCKKCGAPLRDVKTGEPSQCVYCQTKYIIRREAP